MAGNGKISPRQRMINLMYIVLTAMLALNVSSDVLDGFKQVEDGLVRSTNNSTAQNEILYEELSAGYANNPEKSRDSYQNATKVKHLTDSLYNYIADLKVRIVKKADGKDGDVNNIRRQDDLDAASYIMLSPTVGQGKRLRKDIEEYRNVVLQMIPDSVKQRAITDYLSTEVPESSLGTGKNWEEAMFENMPLSAAVTILTKIQGDIRYAEGEVLHSLLKNIDVKDIRVNVLNAFVIPSSKNVIRGGKYSANIVLAAIDSTQQPAIYIGDKQLPAEQKGLYEVVCGSTGVFDFNGYLEVPRGDGTMARHEFTSSYTVVEPTATVSATMMNVLYAGINNPISISVPGIPSQAIQASMTNGTLSRGGAEGWIAKPTKVGQDAVITVSALMDGRSQVVANTKFRVRSLPDPLPFISYKDENGNMRRYRGNVPFPKTLLLAAPGIEAAIDDDLLNVSYRVLRFETIFFDSMGNAIPEVSDGANFSQRQKDSFRRLSRGKRFYISRVRAIGPDGVERDLSTIEVIVN